MTLSDVARRAGVSLTTASHSFTGRRPVSPPTRKRVWSAAFELGFVRHDVAPSVAILIRPPEALSGFAFGTATFASLAGAVAVACLARGFTTLTAHDIADVAGRTPKLDGCVVLYPGLADTTLSALIRHNVPAVSFDPDPGTKDFRWWVGVNYVDSVTGLMTHLASRGAHRIAALAGQTDNMYRRSILGAYTAAATARGATPIIRIADNDRGQAAAEEAASQLLGAKNPPDAVMTSSSVFAKGVLTAAGKLGVRVPGELLIATVTDGPIAEFSNVPVTGLRLDVNGSAERLVELLDARLRGEPEPDVNPAVELELIQRSSTLRHLQP